MSYITRFVTALLLLLVLGPVVAQDSDGARIMLSEVPEAWADCDVLTASVEYPQAESGLRQLPFYLYIVTNLIFRGVDMGNPEAQEFINSLAVAQEECVAIVTPTYSCEPVKTCGDMTSREEANYHLEVCDNTRLDRNNDGVLCESSPWK